MYLDRNLEKSTWNFQSSEYNGLQHLSVNFLTRCSGGVALYTWVGTGGGFKE